MKSRKDFDTDQEYTGYLRTMFAMAAMQGMVQFGSYDIKEEVIRRAIAYADELLKQLES